MITALIFCVTSSFCDLFGATLVLTAVPDFVLPCLRVLSLTSWPGSKEASPYINNIQADGACYRLSLWHLGFDIEFAEPGDVSPFWHVELRHRENGCASGSWNLSCTPNLHDVQIDEGRTLSRMPYITHFGLFKIT
ncbi:hypothetical protein M378DRAFT_160866 [Amanita muscaria Koide BX008]|uniref:Uncharacterized protein n=1 Tax=Amanita muscaria (strain Koide BX008) TaxID=946122 RepID=A0A0C2WX84_AMAMK|nr:hypothetical protein M378DRAFT_160866 [Amanita muscaria Koide BX008]